MGMSIDEAITRYKNNAEYERTHGNLQGCLEFRQLAEWLRKYQKMQNILDNATDLEGTPRLNWFYEQIKEVLDGKA